jgi:hypothetical protein
MQEDRSEKAIWKATSSNVHGTDGNSMSEAENDRKIRTSRSPAVRCGSKGIRFK